jgi:predicted ATPase
MNVRRAKFEDHWRKVFNRTYRARCERVMFNNLRGIRDGEIELANGITAVVGGNGVGKSTLALAVAECLAGEDASEDRDDGHSRLQDCSLRADLRVDGESRTIHVPRKDGAQPSGINFRWLDASRVAVMSQRQVRKDPNFGEILEGLGSRVLGASELAAASYVVGKEYSKCEVYEVRDYGPFEVWPYFRVVVSDVAYSSESMGRGELALLISLWALDVAEKDTTFVVEEPENHVAARSQSALMDMFAWACATRGHSFLITTHSPAILQKLPRSHLRLLVNDGVGSQILSAPFAHQVATVLGGGVAFKFALLVEDECAEAFVSALLDRFEPDLLRQCVLYRMNGEAQIAAALKVMPEIRVWSMLVGCFDGDQREKVDSKDFRNPHLFLPGTVAPDSALRASVSIEAHARLGHALQLSNSQVAIALAGVAGMDTHDWITGVARACGRTIAEMVRALTQEWLGTNEAAAVAFTTELKSIFR